MECRDELNRAIVALDAPPVDQRCMRCNSVGTNKPMTWRCHDCFGNPVFCTHCVQECHQVHPFHRVSRWSGTCFIPSTLSNAGLTLNLGHSGSLCPVYHTLIRQTTDRPTGPPEPPAQINPSSAKFMHRAQESSADRSTLLSGDSSSPLHKFVPSTTPLSSDPGSEITRSSSDDNATASSTFDRSDPPTLLESGRPSLSSQRFWEVAGSVPYEMTIPVPLRADVRSTKAQQTVHSVTGVAIDVTEDPFFANDSEEEEDWKNVEAGGLPLKVRHNNRKYDKLHCPTLTVVDTTGIHELRVRFCQCKSLKINPLQTQLMNMGLYTSSSKRTRTVFTFRVLHHFDITNLEGKTTAWQYYSTLKRITSNVFADTVSDRYRELMRALRQWRDLSSRRRAGQPVDPSVHLKPGDLALFCPACPQPGINLPDNWHEDKDQWVLSSFVCALDRLHVL